MLKYKNKIKPVYYTRIKTIYWIFIVNKNIWDMLHFLNNRFLYE